MKNQTLLAYLLCCFIIFCTSFLYFPRWKNFGAGATISWDVSGYYLYLPAMFIYHDIKSLSFKPDISQKYGPDPNMGQSFHHRSGNEVMKYPIGMAIQYAPFFAIAHLAAEPLGFEPDGFSRPYQFMLQLGGFLMACLGLWYLKKVLQLYFADGIVAAVMILYTCGTNYLNFTALDGAMTHCWLFSWYAILMWKSHRFYQNPTAPGAMAIGAICGIMALTRPTEIIAVIIPLAWDMDLSRGLLAAVQDRLHFILNHVKLFLLSVLCLGAMGSIQLLYWKWVGGEWLIYSYENQGFSWRHPHFREYLFSWQTGWLIYTPLMIFAYLGLFFLLKRRLQVIPVLAFLFVNFWIVCAWDIWEYGGRAMVQSYAVAALPFAAFLDYLRGRKWLQYAFYGFAGLCIYYNVWHLHASHKGEMIDPYNMTKALLFRSVGRWNCSKEIEKLYDTDELFEGERGAVQLLKFENFEQDTLLQPEANAIEGQKSEFLWKERHFTNEIKIPNYGDYPWIRVSATYKCTQKEWNPWRMAMVVVHFKRQGKTVKYNAFRVHRLLTDYSTKEIYFDAKTPKEPYDSVGISWTNGDGEKTIHIDNVRIEAFAPK